VGAATGRLYYGDFRLWREAIEPKERYGRTLLQEFQGIDQPRVLVVPASANAGLDLEARCLGFPNPSSKNRKGWVAVKRALRTGMEARLHRTDPVVWVEDDTRSKNVTSVLGVTITSNAHGFNNGDVVLVRRLGVGLWSLAVVGGTTANSFTVAAVAGTSLHAIQAADEVHLVEAYWLGMVWKDFQPEGEMGWYAKEVVYTFRGSGALSYARSQASVGS
jgi:hypothetical protein